MDFNWGGDFAEILECVSQHDFTLVADNRMHVILYVKPQHF